MVAKFPSAAIEMWPGFNIKLNRLGVHALSQEATDMLKPNQRILLCSHFELFMCLRYLF